MNYSNTMYTAFRGHKGDAKKRGIKFKLSFDEWSLIWRKSRKFPMRGHCKGQFVMARFGDKGAYEIGNVRIISMSNNAKERKQSAKTRAILSRKMLGKQNALGHKQTEEHKGKILATKLKRGLIKNCF